MSATAISNHTIHPKAARTKLKVDQLHMSFKEKRLFIKLTSSFLTTFNHSYSIDNDVLRLYITSTNSEDHYKGEVFEIPIYIPKKGYDAIVNEYFKDHTLHLELEQSQSMLHIA